MKSADDAVWAELYDSIHADVVEDIPFYVEEAKRSRSPVLEVGCGTGRVLIPVAESGVRTFGIDISQAMLEICKGKVAKLPAEIQDRITLMQADMGDFSLPERFGLIYLPFRAFVLMHTPEDQMRALRNFWHHLEDGGRLVLDFFGANVKFLNMGLGDFRGVPRWMGDFTRLDNGNKIVMWFVSTYDAVAQIVDHKIILEELNANGVMIRRTYFPYRVRWIYQYEFEHLLVRCGFEVEALYGTFDRQPYTDIGQQLIWIAKKVLTPVS